MTMHDPIQGMIDKFHRKAEEDEKLRKKLDGVVKTMNIDLGEEKYSMKLDNVKITDFKDENIEDADITFISTPENLQALIDGTLRPMRGYLTKKFSVKGKLEDIMYLKSLF
jgi:putative sterol carrier protein